MLNFDFLEKGLGKVSPAHFVYDFARSMFLMFYSITDQISLSDCLSSVSEATKFHSFFNLKL